MPDPQVIIENPKVSSFNINGNIFDIKDSEAQAILEEIIVAIGENNGAIGTRINDLNNRSFDGLIKVYSSTVNNELTYSESEIASIYDGLYKLQYVTSTIVDDETTETLNDSAILIQKGLDQYLYKDGSLSYRTYDNNAWSEWVNNNVKPDWDATSGSAAEILNKPDLSNFLTMETQANWNETNTSSAAYIQNKPTIPAAQIQADWNQTTDTALDYIKNKPTIPAEQIQADWNQTTTTAKDFIKNKPTIPTVPTTSTTVTQNDTNPVSGGAVYNKFADLIGAAPAALDTLQEIATALNNDADLAGTLTTQISSKVPKVSNPTTDNFASFNSDGTIKDSGSSASDFITSIKTVNNESLVGTGNIVVSGLPQVSASDNGKILMVVNGQWTLVSPSVLYSGNGVPNNANGNNGDLYMQTD